MYEFITCKRTNVVTSSENFACRRYSDINNYGTCCKLLSFVHCELQLCTESTNVAKTNTRI
jgi:hypothetical protein